MPNLEFKYQMDSNGYHLRGNEDHFSARSIEDDDQNRADGYSNNTKTICLSAEKRLGLFIDGIFLPKLFWPTVRKKMVPGGFSHLID